MIAPAMKISGSLPMDFPGGGNRALIARAGRKFPLVAPAPATGICQGRFRIPFLPVRIGHSSAGPDYVLSYEFH